MSKNLLLEPTEKLQKILANSGLGSRREMERWIAAGRVSVDNQIAKLGDRVAHNARIRVDGRLINCANVSVSEHRYIMYNKPEGEVCTRTDPQGRFTVFEHLPKLHKQRWIMVGRLDLNTSGLLLFTTDGELANRLMHPSYQIEREYAVRVLGEVTPQIVKNLLGGVQLEDGPAKFTQIKDIGGEGANHWYRVTIKEGRNREVRRIWETQGITVSRLVRVRFGSLRLTETLKRGKHSTLKPAQVAALKNLVKL